MKFGFRTEVMKNHELCKSMTMFSTEAKLFIQNISEVLI